MLFFLGFIEIFSFLSYFLKYYFFKSATFFNPCNDYYKCMIFKVTTMSDKSELKAELERKKQRLAQIREEKKRKEEERKKKEVRLIQ